MLTYLFSLVALLMVAYINIDRMNKQKCTYAQELIVWNWFLPWTLLTGPGSKGDTVQPKEVSVDLPTTLSGLHKNHLGIYLENILYRDLKNWGGHND